LTDGDDDPDDEFDDIGDEKEEYRYNDDIWDIDGVEEDADTEGEVDDWGGEDATEQVDDN
jgi:hypothetical protein